MYRYSQRISRIILQVYVCAVSDVIYIYISRLCVGRLEGGREMYFGHFFPWYVPLTFQSPYPIIVCFLGNYTPHVNHFRERA